MIQFLESLPITKGILAGEQMRLLAGQREFIEQVYGGSGSVSIGVKSEPRGNGKTGLVAGLAMCHLLGPESEPRGEIYSAAIDRQQAGIIFAELEALIYACQDFLAVANIQRWHKKIEIIDGPATGSIYEALSADARRGHGLSPSLWIYDELAQAKDGELLGNLRTAMGKRERSLGLVISTQAPDDEHPLSQLIDSGLSGEDPSVVVQLLAADPQAPPFDEATIRSVNPALGKFLDERIVFAQAAQARRLTMWEGKYRNLRLNQRVEADADQRLALASDWRACERIIDLDGLAGRPCFGGLDLSQKQDLTAFLLAFPDDDGGFDVVPFFWTPEGELSNRPTGEEERFRQWIRSGHLEAIPGPLINLAIVAERIAGLAQRFDIRTIAYDDWQLKEPSLQLDLDVPWEKFGQGHSRSMAASIRFTNECIRMGRLRHNGNPALTGSVLSACVIPDTSGNPKLDKKRARTGMTRIDGAVALVMALGTASSYAGDHVAERLVFA